MSYCIEVLKWKSKDGISDFQTVEAVNNMVGDLNTCEGFIHQSLYKVDDFWCDVYYWRDAGCAHGSNDFMSRKDSLIELMALIDVDTITIEVAEPLQSSGDLSLKFTV